MQLLTVVRVKPAAGGSRKLPFALNSQSSSDSEVASTRFMPVPVVDAGGRKAFHGTVKRVGGFTVATKR